MTSEKFSENEHFTESCPTVERNMAATAMTQPIVRKNIQSYVYKK